MSYDDIIEVLAAALLEKAETVGCLEVLDGFSQRPDTEIEVSAPISEEMLALPLDKQEWPEERTPILKESSAATLGELVEYTLIPKNRCSTPPFVWRATTNSIRIKPTPQQVRKPCCGESVKSARHLQKCLFQR